MGSLEFRQQVASDMYDGLVDSDMADAGTYTDPGIGATPVPCRVVISRQRAPKGTFGKVMSDKTTIRLLLAEIPAPKRDGVIAADGGTFKLVGELLNDGAMAIWDVA